MASSALLLADDLALSRGDRRLLSGFALQLCAHEVVHLVGHNGVGKTSLMECLAGLRAPEQGRLQRPEPEQLHWVGHKNALHPALTVEENLRYWCQSQSVSGADLPAAMARLGLSRQCARAARQLSTGQKRRTALARLLLQRRAVWLLDEPLAGLDTDGIATVAALIAEHRSTGGAVLMTSHQPLPDACGMHRVLRLGA